MKWVRTFSEIGIGDVALVGGKNASLGEMYSSLGEAGVPVPDGFALTAAAYWHHLRENRIEEAVAERMRGLDKNDVADLQRRCKEARYPPRTTICRPWERRSC